MIGLVTLDMAGTTIEEGGQVYAALQHVVEEAGAPVAPADLRTHLGTDKATAITALLRAGGVEPTPELVSERFHRFRDLLARAYADHPPRPMPGAEDVIAELRARSIKVALTTGFDRVIVDLLLGGLGWSTEPDARLVLDAVITTDDVAAGRPAPYLIFHAMEATDVRAVAGTVSVGDTVADLTAARCSGGIAVGVLSGAAGRSELAQAAPDHLIDSVADLLTLPMFS
ncbi:phosphonatase-like hydrolase [Granulicoccus phenolivorans]|uniref:phosphonatase-like hydrolase n=1 Tax=Granulicoccus phenolivorans TaxID=266854 RepID=UPI0003FC2A99|nr:phosphonatase-like hydrolase [Granulicoccus phenolivorans]